MPARFLVCQNKGAKQHTQPLEVGAQSAHDGSSAVECAGSSHDTSESASKASATQREIEILRPGQIWFSTNSEASLWEFSLTANFGTFILLFLIFFLPSCFFSHHYQKYFRFIKFFELYFFKFTNKFKNNWKIFKFLKIARVPLTNL